MTKDAVTHRMLSTCHLSTPRVQWEGSLPMQEVTSKLFVQDPIYDSMIWIKTLASCLAWSQRQAKFQDKRLAKFRTVWVNSAMTWTLKAQSLRTDRKKWAQLTSGRSQQLSWTNNKTSLKQWFKSEMNHKLKTKIRFRVRVRTRIRLSRRLETNQVKTSIAWIRLSLARTTRLPKSRLDRQSLNWTSWLKVLNPS